MSSSLYFAVFSTSWCPRRLQRTSTKYYQIFPFAPVQSTPGALRLPPNHHDANLYTLHPTLTSDHPLLSTLTKAPCESHPIPNVPAAFLISDVLTLEECERIVKACESKGFEEDEPVDSTAPLGGSVLAHVNCLHCLPTGTWWRGADLYSFVGVDRIYIGSRTNCFWTRFGLGFGSAYLL